MTHILIRERDVTHIKPLSVLDPGDFFIWEERLHLLLKKDGISYHCWSFHDKRERLIANAVEVRYISSVIIKHT